MTQRVVVTGLGVVSSNGVGVDNFTDAIRNGASGIRFLPELAEHKFICTVGGIPPISPAEREEFCDKYNLIKLRSSGILYGCLAGIEAWFDAGLDLILPESEMPDWDSGCIFGSVSNGMESIEHGIRVIDKGDVRKMGGRAAQQAMNSGVSAYLGGIIGMGNQVTTNSSGSNTGTESIIEGYNRIKYGYAQRILAGSTEGSSPYIWAGCDCMTVGDSIFHDNNIDMYAMVSGFEDNPEKASAPMSVNAAGFVHGSGAGALVLESLESAKKRNARIYAEILGGQVNAGGAKGSRGIQFLNGKESMVQCIQQALTETGISGHEVDLISGDMISSPQKDLHEVSAWAQALGVDAEDYPRINSLKSMIGHCNGGAGAIESVACVLQLFHDFVHPTINTEELQPKIKELLNPAKISTKTEYNAGLKIIAKGSFAFGDLNSCLILKKWEG